jgi:23S rRNA (uracil1939-C5)-methyltransferase
MKKNDILELFITKYAFEGKGIAKIARAINNETPAEENFVVFVSGSYPGDVVRAQIRKIKKNYAEAKIVEVITPSVERTSPKCKYFGTCGGCKQQDLEYSSQIKYKELQVKEIFEKLGGFENLIVEPILASERIFFYRNKMEFSFADKRWLSIEEISTKDNIQNDFAVGLHIPGLYDKVLDIDECFLQSEISNGILKLTREFFKSRYATIYTTKTHTGFLRNLIVKQASHTKDLMVNIVTSSYEPELITEYAKSLLNEFPQITTIINNVSAKKALIALGDFEKIIYGPGFIIDEIGGYSYRISANSFFQTNTIQAEHLYNVVLDYAELNGTENVFDLYSGAGTISIFLSRHSKIVYGIEVVDSAVEDAEVNKKLNKIENVFFFQSDLYKSFLPVVTENNLPNPEVIILDPPRGGMHLNTVTDVIALSPKRIVYVSCNPTTQVRDIKLFVQSGYKLVKMRPVDMFPHTYHIENVALLTKE